MDPASTFRTRESYLVYLIPLSIFIAKFLEIFLRIFNVDFASAPDAHGWFIANFISWFGVVYGLLLPLILVRAWEQLDRIDREFDREADAVKALYKDLFFLGGEGATFRAIIAAHLHEYVVHILSSYPYEVKRLDEETREAKGILARIKQFYDDLTGPVAPAGGPRLASGDRQKAKAEEPRVVGDHILEDIRQEYVSMFRPSVLKSQESEFLSGELFEKLDKIIDIRGDRIGLASQRLFESLRIIALITSIIFVVPFYFVGFFSFPSGLLDDILIVGVTLLAIVIFLIIEDLDEPFTGVWRIDASSWQRVLAYMDHPKRQSELQALEREEQEGTALPDGKADGKVIIDSAKPKAVKKEPSTKSRARATPALAPSRQKATRKTKPS